MTVDCLNDAAAVIDITNESGEEIMLEGKDSENTDKVWCEQSYSGIGVGQEINIGPGKFGKKNT